MLFPRITSCPPGDFERHAAILLSVTELLTASPQATIDIIRPLIHHIPLILLVRDEPQREDALTLLTDCGLPAQNLHFAFMPVGSWTRDFGPSFVRGEDGRICILDAEYLPSERRNEDIVPTMLAPLLGVESRRVPLVLAGGNLLSNGQGISLCTTGIIGANHDRGHPYTVEQIRQILGSYYGFTQPVLLMPIHQHHTLHVDMFATFTSPDTVVVGEYDRGGYPEVAQALDVNADILARLRTHSGPLRVFRIPMPPYDGTVCRTYTNVLYANGRLLVPHYPDVPPRIEMEVMELYAQLLPGWELIRVDCTELIRFGGALRCLSAHVPWLHERFAPQSESLRSRLKSNRLLVR